QFREAVEVVALIGVLQGARFLVLWPNTLALSVGRSDNVLLTNLLRLIALPIAIFGMTSLGGLTGLLAGLVAGALLAGAAAVALTNRQAGIAPTAGLDRLLAFATIAGLTLAWSHAAHALSVWPALGLALATLAAAAWLVRREARTLASAAALLRRVWERM